VPNTRSEKYSVCFGKTKNYKNAGIRFMIHEELAHKNSISLSELGAHEAIQSNNQSAKKD